MKYLINYLIGYNFFLTKMVLNFVSLHGFNLKLEKHFKNTILNKMLKELFDEVSQKERYYLKKCVEKLTSKTCDNLQGSVIINYANYMSERW